ncbi:cutinase family protein [Candidatus Saccharibacteria bacterium]|nr:cutinase family protein [Candidatus Saccharibacteria bacterium]MBI3337904.1 cutinase family protein [Candidatus Saccharibacteria bacterium]
MLFLLILTASVQAKKVDNWSTECSDVLLIFARGSSSNNAGLNLDEPFEPPFLGSEPEAGTFFQKFQNILDQDYPHVTYKAVSVHDFPNKYSPVGYKAVHAFAPAPQFIDRNTLNSEWSVIPGEYRDSVYGGVSEVSGFVRDEAARCPNQQIVLGGYSQGAEVVGNGLFKLTEDERKSIAGVAFFGDPKYNASYKDSQGNYQEQPWRRGHAPLYKTGMLDPRKPYIPDDMKKRVQSWCFDDDFICTGTKTFAGGLVDWASEGKSLGAGHSRYPSFGVPQAASEIVQLMSPTLYALNKSRGGIDKGAGPTQTVPYVPNTKPIDVMFLIDVSYNVNDVMGTLRTQTDSVTGPMQGFFNGVRYGFAYYNELDQYGTMLPRYVIGQQPAPYQPVNSPIYSTPLTSNLINKLAWGDATSGGGADVPDPHGIMVEKTSLGTYWDPKAIKHIVLITDRPFKESFTYNICNASIWTQFNLPNPPNCYTNPEQVSALSYKHPELCDKVWLAITEETCSLNMASPGFVHNITRTFDDAIKVAQTQRTDVTVVIPHGLTATVTDKPAAEKRLEYFAKATGGLYLKYDVFGKADYTDMLWRVLNHQPKQIALAYKDALEILGPNQVLGVSDQIKARTNVPITLDVSESPITADEYKWDFNGDGTWDKETESPNIEHTFTVPTTDNFVQVAAYAGEEEQARTTLPLTVEQYDGPLPDYTSPELPTNLQAKVTANGEIEVTWDPDGEIFVVIKDPETGLPIVSVPGSNGSITIPNSYFSGDALLALAVTEDASSKPQTLEVEQLPIEVVNQEDLEFVKFNGLSPGETVAGNEILNTNTAEVVQAASTTAIQTPGLATTPNVLAENVVSGSQVLSRTASPALASDSVAATQPIPSNSEASQQPPYLLIVLVVGGGVVAAILAIAKKTDN